MKMYFDFNLVSKAQEHAKRVYPKESCGFLLRDRYLPMENWAEDTVNGFKIKQMEFIKHKENIMAVMHSHADYPHLSKADMLQQIETGVPWGITFIDNGALTDTYFWGDQLEIQDLIGRPFVHGMYDCYAIVRDYWRLEGYNIMEFPRENLWWQKDPSMLENGCQEAGFYFIDESDLQIGDVVFMKVMAPVVNHSGIYIGDGLILHHLYNRLSRREPLNRWRKYVSGYLRYNKC